MSPRLHFLLLRYAHFLLLLLGFALTVWFWGDWNEKAVLVFFLPSLCIFFLLPPLFRTGLPASCPCCSSPVRITAKKREPELLEYIYRCRACTHQHETGVYFRRNPS